MPVSGNRYLTMDEMKINAIYIKDYLIANGWTLNSICGMLGNMQSESTINSGIWQSLNEGNMSGGFGLVQWTPATKYLNWCTENALPYDDMASNLMRILFEVQTGIQWYDATMTFTEFTQSTDTPYNLALKFISAYERPANPNQPIRGTRAQYWYDYLSGGIYPDPDPTHIHNEKTITLDVYNSLSPSVQKKYKLCPICGLYFYYYHVPIKTYLLLKRRRNFV